MENKIKGIEIEGRNFVVVPFPESQEIENKEGFLDNCELINSDLGIEVYGGAAYTVKKEWLDQVNNGEIQDKEYTEDELIDGLECNYDTSWIK